MCALWPRQIIGTVCLTKNEMQSFQIQGFQDISTCISADSIMGNFLSLVFAQHVDRNAFMGEMNDVHRLEVPVWQWTGCNAPA